MDGAPTTPHKKRDQVNQGKRKQTIWRTLISATPCELLRVDREMGRGKDMTHNKLQATLAEYGTIAILFLQALYKQIMVATHLRFIRALAMPCPTRPQLKPARLYSPNLTKIHASLLPMVNCFTPCTQEWQSKVLGNY